MSKKSYDEKWGPHAHCVVCGQAIAEGQKYCGDACDLKYEEELKKAKRQQKISLIFIGTMCGFIILMFMISYIF